MIPTLNLEYRPTLPEALTRVRAFLETERRRGTRVVQIIHGYGSSGVGGTLRAGIRKELGAMKGRGDVRAFIPGEDLRRGTAGIKRLVNDFPDIKRLKDYGRGNPGITVVVLSR